MRSRSCCPAPQASPIRTVNAIDSPSGEEAEISAELQRRFVDDMVTACRIMAAIVTQPHDS